MAISSNTIYSIGNPGAFATNSETLGTTYVVGASARTHEVGGHDQLIVVMEYQPGVNAQKLLLKVQFSYDNGTTWITQSIGVDGTPAAGEVETPTYERVYSLTGASTAIVYGRRIPISLGDQSLNNVLCRAFVSESGAGGGKGRILLSSYKNSQGN